jgi:hypothetical protein
MPWHSQRSQQELCQLAPFIDKGRHEVAIRPGILPECLTGHLNGTLEERCGPIVEGMGQRRRWVDPVQTMLLQRETPEKWGAEAQRMDGRADIVYETR